MRVEQDSVPPSTPKAGWVQEESQGGPAPRSARLSLVRTRYGTGPRFSHGAMQPMVVPGGQEPSQDWSTWTHLAPLPTRCSYSSCVCTGPSRTACRSNVRGVRRWRRTSGHWPAVPGPHRSQPRQEAPGAQRVCAGDGERQVRAIEPCRVHAVFLSDERRGGGGRLPLRRSPSSGVTETGCGITPN
jgi:hypothetical protein